MPSNVAVVIVNYRTPELALGAVRSLAAERGRVPGLRVVVADGGSGDGSAEAIGRGLADPALAGWATTMPLAVNGGFGWANNQAMQMLMQGKDPPDFIHLLNPDAEIEPGAVAELVAVLEREPRCAAVGSLLLDPDGSPSGSAFRFQGPMGELVRGARVDAMRRLLRLPSGLVEDAPSGVVDWATGASLMLRTAALREVGLFDTGFFLYFEEVELMWRLNRAGWTVRHEPASRVRHVGGAATGVRDGETRSRLAAPRPPYWYASRRRFYALSRGRGIAAAANLAWLAGNALFGVRRLLGFGQQHMVTRSEARDLFRHGVLADTADITPQIARWDEPVGCEPAWMRQVAP